MNMKAERLKTGLDSPQAHRQRLYRRRSIRRYRRPQKRAGHRLTFLRMPGVNRQGQAHIVSTASRLRTCVSIDPQPASISPTINISIVFICAFLVDCGRSIRHSAIKNDSSAILSSGQSRLEIRNLRYFKTTSFFDPRL